MIAVNLNSATVSPSAVVALGEASLGGVHCSCTTNWTNKIKCLTVSTQLNKNDMWHHYHWWLMWLFRIKRIVNLYIILYLWFMRILLRCKICKKFVFCHPLKHDFSLVLGRNWFSIIHKTYLIFKERSDHLYFKAFRTFQNY